MIEAIREYFLLCPFMDGLAKLDVDFLDNEAVNYSIEVLPGDRVLKEYADGGRVIQFDFVIGSRAFYGDSVRDNLDNLKFFDDLCEWVECNNRKGILPAGKDKRYPQEVQVLTQGYVLDADSETARYQVQCKFIYYEEV